MYIITNEKSHSIYIAMVKSPIDHNQIFDGYNFFIHKLKNVKKNVTYFDFHICTSTNNDRFKFMYTL